MATPAFRFLTREFADACIGCMGPSAITGFNPLSHQF